MKFKNEIRFLDDKTINLGGFKTAKEAAKIYDNYAAILFGEFALLNFKRDNYQSLNKEA